MFKRLAAGLLTALFLTVSTSAAVAAPAIWKATDSDSEIWLFGSVHLLTEETEWMTPTLKKAIESADVYYYEIPMNASTKARVASLVARYGMNLGGKKLTDYLSSGQTALLKEVTGELGIPMAMLQLMKPWLASLTLQLTYLKKAGYRPNAGVEQRLDPLTPDKKERYFETAKEQIGFFTDMSEDVAVSMLVATLNQIREHPDYLDRLVAAWAAGDVDTLKSLFARSMKKAGPELYETLVLARNRAWAEELLALMEGDTDALVIVGAGHMVGEKGVPALLEAAGVTVKRIQ